MTDLDRLRSCTLFEGLSEPQLDRILTEAERRSAVEGEPFFAEGDGGREVYVLLEGRVQISVRMSCESEQVPVHTVVPGHVFGEFALVADHQRSATALASQPASCVVFSREQLEALAEEDPRLGYLVLRNLGRIVVERLIKTTQELRASLMF